MGRTKFSSPTLHLTLTEEAREHAIQSNSGGCLIADAIRQQYPEYTSVSVDMATIRVTDRKAGRRYIYLTPPAAQHVLLSFDQGWPQPLHELVIKRAVNITPIRRERTGRDSPEGVERRRSARIADLEAKEASEGLTPHERMALTRMRNVPPVLSRPGSYGPVEEHNGVVYGGDRPPQGPAHPNLLRSRNRHFGAKLADPGDAFRQAVEQAVNERLQTMEQEGKAS